MAGAAEVPNAAERNGEAEDGGDGGEPAPRSGVGVKAEGGRKEPKPEREEGTADEERGEGGGSGGEGRGVVRRVRRDGGHGSLQ